MGLAKEGKEGHKWVDKGQRASEGLLGSIGVDWEEKQSS